ncbi:MAG: circularly permuted type 2 ATP-grasp protein [Ilumatobacteraceae bacterium]
MAPTITGFAEPPLYPPADLRDELLDPVALVARQARADRLLAAEGAGHLVHDLPVRADGRLATIESRPWRLDPIPVVLDASTFRWLSLAVAQRMEALELVLADLYGERTLVRERIVPAEGLASTHRYRVNAVGSAPRRWLSTYAVDVTLDAEGRWWVVQDLTDAPPGLGYALLDRSVMSRVLPDMTGGNDIASLARFPASLRRALAAASDSESPRIVLFSGGLDHPSYVDHSYLAVQLGINLVEGADLVVRKRRVLLRTLDGLEPVDVLYRRIEDPFLDPLEIAARGKVGVPGLVQAVRSGGVTIANSHGSGVLEVPELASYIDAGIERLRPVEQALTRLDHPGRSLALVPLAPGSVDPGLSAAGVVIRLFAVHDGVSVQVLPGGTGRVLAPGDHPHFPTACTAKDVWVLGHTTALSVGPRLPQVDFGRSVPTRAADALYWTNRAAERAEAMARTMRVISSRIEQDPGLVGLGAGEWTARMQLVAARVRRHRNGAREPVPSPTLDALRDELSLIGDAVANEIGSLLTEATTVREFLSVTTGRVLSHLAELRSSLQQRTTVVDDLDAVLADFAALAGLWQESTVRGPAWRIGDTGRRLERCLVVLDLIEGTIGGTGSSRGVGSRQDEVEAAAIEVLLAANDSLVAYRRRYRSDVELDAAVDLLVRDASNPRSLAASIDRLELHAVAGEWAVGGPFIEQARQALLMPVDQMLPHLRTVIDEAGERLVSRWFSTPVNPIVLSPTGRGDR